MKLNEYLAKNAVKLMIKGSGEKAHAPSIAVRLRWGGSQKNKTIHM